MGLWTNSLALLSDAGHMLSDMFALGLSLFAFWLSSRKPSPTKTYGYYRFEVVAAFINGVLLILIALWIFGEAYSRFQGTSCSEKCSHACYRRVGADDKPVGHLSTA